MKSTKYILISIAIFCITTIAVNIPYLITFPGGFSGNSQDWSNYASYFSSLLTPLITFSGVVLVVKEYILSSKLKHQEERIKIIEKIEIDISATLNQNCFYIVENKYSHNCDFNFLLESKNSINYTTLTKCVKDIKRDTDFVTDIEILMQCLLLLFLNAQYISKNYQKYYSTKYKYLTEYLVMDRYFAFHQIENIIDEEHKKQIQIEKEKLIKISTVDINKAAKLIDEDF